MGQIPGGAPLITQAIAGTTQSARAAATESDEKTKRQARIRDTIRDEVHVTPTEESSAVRSQDDADAHERDQRKPTHHAGPTFNSNDPEGAGGHLDLSA